MKLVLYMSEILIDGIPIHTYFFQEERSTRNTDSEDGAAGSIDNVCTIAENLRIEQNQSDSSLPYPVQRHTPSENSMKLRSDLCREQFNKPGDNLQNSPKPSEQTGGKTAVHNRGYVRLNNGGHVKAKKPIPPKKPIPQKNPIPHGLPSENLQTDADPSDTQPRQETRKAGTSGKREHYV